MQEKDGLTCAAVFVLASETGLSLRAVADAADQPLAEFACSGEMVKAQAFCNLHGLWSS